MPSWRYRQRLVDLGLDPRQPEYAEHLGYLRATVDERVEQHDWQDYGDAELDAFERELLGDARAIAQHWRAAARMTHAEDVDAAFPRRPLCQLPGGTCDLVGPCMRDGAQVRLDYEVTPWQTWAARSPGAPSGADGAGAAVVAASSNTQHNELDW